MGSKAIKCLFPLREECKVAKRLIEQAGDKVDIGKWGTDEWVKIYCAMCVKALYAKAKFKAVSKYSVVNTL